MNLGEKVTLQSICNGAIEEVFQKCMADILDNIKDPNTQPEAKRELNIKLSFNPFPDRSGMTVTFSPKTTMAQIGAVSSTLHISLAGGELAAYPHDPRQEKLFQPEIGMRQ